MPLLFEHLQEAGRSLKSTRTRTLLTILGIAIGVASVTTILSLNSGITSVISKQVKSLDGNIALVRPKSPISNDPRSALTTPVSHQSFHTSLLTMRDVDTINKIEGVEEVAPIMVLTGSLRANKNTINDGLIVSTSPELASISNLKIRDGQFIDTVTNSNTAVIGTTLAMRLFGTDQPIGRTFIVRGQLFTIIGVLEHMNDPINFNSINFNDSAIINQEAGRSFLGGKNQIQQINIRVSDTNKMSKTMNLVKKQLNKNHDGEQDFSLTWGGDISTPTNQLFVAITGVMTAIAAISLVVGGIGIMNIMLVGVAERTREIGLRKAIGASNHNILEQFLIESLLVSLAGGLIGYSAGVAIALVVGRILDFVPGLGWEVAAVALGLSVVVGIVFGLYPAIRAARKDPIESLRQYH